MSHTIPSALICVGSLLAFVFDLHRYSQQQTYVCLRTEGTLDGRVGERARGTCSFE